MTTYKKNVKYQIINNYTYYVLENYYYFQQNSNILLFYTIYKFNVNKLTFRFLQ